MLFRSHIGSASCRKENWSSFFAYNKFIEAVGGKRFQPEVFSKKHKIGDDIDRGSSSTSAESPGNALRARPPSNEKVVAVGDLIFFLFKIDCSSCLM